MAALTDRQKFRAVIEEQRTAELLRQKPNPRRITSALDLRGLYGPQVDRDLGGEEPMVDEWESGKRIPTPEQIEALGRLTDFPTAYFYLPTGPEELGPIIMCGTKCEVFEREPHPSDPTADVIPLFGQGRLI